MPFDWKGLVEVAHQLERLANEGANVEALQRSAVSRAYFGAYLPCAQFLNFRSREDSDDHGRLRSHLKARRRHADAKRLELRQWRNDADYRNDLPWAGIAATVSSALLEAGDIFRSLVWRRSYLNDSGRFS